MMYILVNNVLKNIWIWGMAITYFFIYVIRQGVTSWSIFFLMNVKGTRKCYCCYQANLVVYMILLLLRKCMLRLWLVTRAGL